jgi:hypothetical protein
VEYLKLTPKIGAMTRRSFAFGSYLAGVSTPEGVTLPTVCRNCVAETKLRVTKYKEAGQMVTVRLRSDGNRINRLVTALLLTQTSTGVWTGEAAAGFWTGEAAAGFWTGEAAAGVWTGEAAAGFWTGEAATIWTGVTAGFWTGEAASFWTGEVTSIWTGEAASFWKGEVASIWTGEATAIRHSEATVRALGDSCSASSPWRRACVSARPHSPACALRAA